ncbi:glycosyltransferase family 2 protein [Anaerosinus massiliensis]|uniref:glycosyltransferase family 2 protein n=1 Tax=Massilibacillus massiliensis TaxID=1806837 RepID=UPI000A825CFA|nr:glycosyltransferase family A protein [Massilibacillus massiliensis]
MISAIVPAKNEAGRAVTVLRNLALLPIDHIILIVNGCRDTTLYESLNLKLPKLQLLYFHECLGIDVPRAIGAKVALTLGSDIVLFIDGDMVGTFNDKLTELLETTLSKKIDMALTNCYPTAPRHIEKCNPTFKWRLKLNQELALDKKLNIASPVHGPHVLSKKLLKALPLNELAIPPVSLALAKKHKLKIEIGTTIPHYLLGSSVKGNVHSTKIIDTIVGDCLEAISLYKNEPRTRQWLNKTYIGYHNERRFDILDEILTEI